MRVNTSLRSINNYYTSKQGIWLYQSVYPSVIRFEIGINNHGGKLDTQCLRDLLLTKRTDQSLRQRGHDYIKPCNCMECFKLCFVNRYHFNFI